MRLVGRHPYRGNEDAIVGLHGPGVLRPLVKGNHIQLSSAEEEEEERVSPAHSSYIAGVAVSPIMPIKQSSNHVTFGGGL